jgi:hypothetical protein
MVDVMRLLPVTYRALDADLLFGKKPAAQESETARRLEVECK